jgi:hypothetical protein
MLAAVAACSLDPVRDDAVRDLGGEARGIPVGPEHRPGQPCLVCHDGSRATPAMSVAGTVYGALDSPAPLAGVGVTLTDASGAIRTASTNGAGNFYIEASSWEPTFPLRVVIDYGQITAPMSTIVGRDGSCASCHYDPPSRISVGRLYVVPSASLLPDAGMP